MALDILKAAWVIPALPLTGAIFLLLFGKRLKGSLAGWIGSLLMSLAFFYVIATFFALRSLPQDQRLVVHNLFTWFHAGSFTVNLGFLVDPLSVVMLLFITGVGALIHFYSIGYMHGDPRFSRFFAYMNLFATFMIILVLGSNFLVTFLGWEGVGLCSYLLISFWFERNTAAVAGKKAFITNRVGDFGFMIAMFLIFSHLGTLDYQYLFTHVGLLSSGTVTAIALLLFLGAIGKSAQLPLHIWLPDAMEGPTPVSALIHAATMVTAGVYLLCRTHVLLGASPTSAHIIAWVGVITALYAATVALVTNDIKRVLAYSTISQLGYMFLAVGTGAYTAAIFHMVTHAFFKATLFLGAGSVMHGLGNEQDMRFMGKLRKYMPMTASVFIAAWLAIAGVFPFAGFWSKDAILDDVWFHHDYALWGIGIFTAFLTAFYMTRQVRLVFYGGEHYRDPQHKPHESPKIMLMPLVVLATLSVIGGAEDLPFKPLEFLNKWLDPVFADAHSIKEKFVPALTVTSISLFLAAIGIVVAIRFYKRDIADHVDPLPSKLGVLGNLFSHAWFIDEGVSAVVGGPLRRFASWTSDVFDRKVIDGAVNGAGTTVRDAGSRLRRLQTGLLRNYALWIVIGLAAMVIYVLVAVH